jgi:hypothetical protein
MHTERVTDSCFNKCAIGLLAGGGGGVVFGVILGAMPGGQMDTMEQSQKAERLKSFRPKMRLYFGEPWSRAKGTSSLPVRYATHTQMRGQSGPSTWATDDLRAHP